MRNGELTLKYVLSTAAPAKKAWGALTDGPATKQYFYGCSVQSTFKKGARVSYLGDGEFTMLDGEVIEVKPEEHLVTTFQAHWDEKVSQDKPSRVSWHRWGILAKSPLYLIDSIRKQRPTSNRQMAGTSFFRP